jgi:putative FmdB family regulatory protein
MPIYEYQCRKCKGIFEVYCSRPNEIVTEECPQDGELGDRIYSLSALKMFPVFSTRNILPGGEPVTVKSSSQLRQLEAEHKVKMVDADFRPPQTTF